MAGPGEAGTWRAAPRRLRTLWNSTTELCLTCERAIGERCERLTSVSRNPEKGCTGCASGMALMCGNEGATRLRDASGTAARMGGKGAYRAALLRRDQRPLEAARAALRCAWLSHACARGTQLGVECTRQEERAGAVRAAPGLRNGPIECT